MSGIVSMAFFVTGIIWAIIGMDTMEVLACFLIYAILDGVWQIQELRKDLEDMDDE